MSKVVVLAWGYEGNKEIIGEFEDAGYGVNAYQDVVTVSIYRHGNLIATYKNWDSVEVVE